jgi:Transposase IS4
VFGDKASKLLEIPRIVDDYNHHMGSVDIADQLHAAYRTHLKGVRTWYPLFYWLLDVSLSNSYLALKAKFPSVWTAKRGGHKSFRLSVASAFMGRTIDTVGEIAGASMAAPSLPSGASGGDKSRTKRRRRNSSDLMSDDARLQYSVQHGGRHL